MSVCVCACALRCVFDYVFLFVCLLVCCYFYFVLFLCCRCCRKKYDKLIKASRGEGVDEESGNEGGDDDDDGVLAAGRSGSGKKKRGPADPFQGVREETESDAPAIEKKPLDKDREEGIQKIEEKSFLGDGHHGSARHLSKLAMNALTIVSELGRPTFFLTLTCNHLWPEIQCRLFPGQSAFDREDVVDQV